MDIALNISTGPGPVTKIKKFQLNKNKKQRQQKIQDNQQSDGFAFTFSKNNKVSATVAKVKSVAGSQLPSVRRIKPALKLPRKLPTAVKTTPDITKSKQNDNESILTINTTSSKDKKSTDIHNKDTSMKKSTVSNDYSPNKSNYSSPKTYNKNSNSNDKSLFPNTTGSKVSSVSPGSKVPFSNTPKSSTAKISSLFGNNPEVVTIGQRLVKPVNETVFSGMPLSSLAIHPHCIKNLADLLNISELTTVQQQTVPVVLAGRDVLVRSQTGSGKTLAYALPIVQSLQEIRPKLSRTDGIRALIVVPSRELALQTYELFVKLLKPFTWIVPGYLMGGEKRKAEKARLRKGINILVGTPGRLCDHLTNTTSLKLSGVKWLVLDEADRLLELSYERDVKKIVDALSTEKSAAWYDPMARMKEAIGAKSNLQISNEQSQIPVESVIKSESDDSDSDMEALDSRGKLLAFRGTKAYIKKDIKSIVRREPEYDSDRSIDVESDDGKVKSEPESDDVEQTPLEMVKDESGSKDHGGLLTILLSATLTSAVEKLAGLALRNPVFINTGDQVSVDKNAVGFKDAIKHAAGEEMSIPSSVAQSYIVVPPKLRLVTLSAIIVKECRKKNGAKVFVFMATQDLVDFHFELMREVLGSAQVEGGDDSDDEGGDPLVDVEFFKLHGSMTQPERTKVFRAFETAKSGVLLCTDVAARGIDVPELGLVVQYGAPPDTADYVHRVGRTARAGRAGQAVLFLAPNETQYVRLLEDRRIRLKQATLEPYLEALVMPWSPHGGPQTAATSLQQRYEERVASDKDMYRKACKAFQSWVRFYSTFPRVMKAMFNVKDAHLGHYAKSLALREPPKKAARVQGGPKEQHAVNRLTVERINDDRKHRGGLPSNKAALGAPHKRLSGQKREQMLITSEYSSGLPAIKKKRK